MTAVGPPLEFPVDLSTALSADLKNMFRVLDLPALDVERSLLALRVDVQLAVPSFVGLSMTLMVHGHPVTLTSMDENTFTAIASSLQLPLALTAAVATGSRLVLYAATPGAFVDLAADLSFALAAPDGEVAVDEDLRPCTMQSGLTGIAELSIINRAIGLLMGRGLTPEAAQSHLQRRADQGHLRVFQVAAFMVSMSE